MRYLDVIQRRLSGLHTPRLLCMAQLFNNFLIGEKEVGLGKSQVRSCSQIVQSGKVMALFVLSQLSGRKPESYNINSVQTLLIQGSNKC